MKRSVHMAIGAIGLAAILGTAGPLWAQGGAGEVGSSGGSGNQSSSGATQKSQEMMHQERMKEQRGETSMQMRPDRNDQSHSQPKAPHGGGSDSPKGSQRGQ
jgi:hypothetical protein